MGRRTDPLIEIQQCIQKQTDNITRYSTMELLRADHITITIKGGYRHAEKSRKVLMKAAKLGWAGPGAGAE